MTSEHSVILPDNTSFSDEEESDNQERLPEHFHHLLNDPLKAPYISYRGEESQLRVGYVPGVMPGKWFTRWHGRFDKNCPLMEIPLAQGQGISSLENAEPASLAHMVLLRPAEEPASADKARFHSITLYYEKLVLVLPADHELTLYETEIPLKEIAEENLLQEPETVPHWANISAEFRAQHPFKLPQMRNIQDAVELVAAGLGLLIVPMSIARLYHRKDLTYRVVDGLEESAVNLVWNRTERSEEEEQIIQDFVGICRGRTAGSDRGTDSLQTQRERASREKEEAKQKRQAANARRETRDRKARNARKNGNARQHQAQQNKNRAASKSGGRKKR